MDAELADPESLGTSEASNADPSTLSKRQKKKLIKLQQWEVKKREKRLRQKEKRREKIANGEKVRSGPSRKALKRSQVEITKSLISVVIDLTFEDLMDDKSVAKCVKQLLRVYTVNRRSTHPMQLYFAGIQSGSRSQHHLERNDGYQKWDVTFSEKSYLDLGFDKEKIVYLTAESDEEISEFVEGNVYVIGGLVDHNTVKGWCHKQAEKNGIKTARLPLSKYVTMKTRAVLAIPHVFEIVSKVSDGNDWPSTLMKVIPSRKGAIQRVTEAENSGVVAAKGDNNNEDNSEDNDSDTSGDDRNLSNSNSNKNEVAEDRNEKL